MAFLRIATEIPGLSLVIGEDGTVWVDGFDTGSLPPVAAEEVRRKVTAARRCPTPAMIEIGLLAVLSDTIQDELRALDDLYQQAKEKQL